MSRQLGIRRMARVLKARNLLNVAKLPEYYESGEYFRDLDRVLGRKHKPLAGNKVAVDESSQAKTECFDEESNSDFGVSAEDDCLSRHDEDVSSARRCDSGGTSSSSENGGRGNELDIDNCSDFDICSDDSYIAGALRAARGMQR
mmetsp:Transcript_19645/g.27654  ORF Transcript_19645/g.27654 Transcript_19645/m.27654 type:complete len:145 (+) Transcript_19645:2-436(+)